ncbi:ATP-binding cassette domain-containing protein, partial [Staphylococcus aureus]|uniref:ATP-binding cassette domain-containing protein n=1 Tax=Staphylococcus aureus TaxID=1280 RepID=UPI002181ECFD
MRQQSKKILPCLKLFLIKDLGQAFHTGKQSEGSSDIVFGFLNTENETPNHTPEIVPTQSNQIEMTDVAFQYDEKSLFAIQNLSLSIRQGEKIAIVGPSGAGKTTLAKLLTQTLEPTNGQVTFDAEVKNIGMLSQHPYIFAATIKENIAMFKTVSD